VSIWVFQERFHHHIQVRRWYIPLKCHFTYTLHGAVSLKMPTFLSTAMRTWKYSTLFRLGDKICQTVFRGFNCSVKVELAFFFFFIWRYSPGWALASLTTSLLWNLARRKVQLWDICPFSNNTRSDMPECPDWCDVKISTASCNRTCILVNIFNFMKFKVFTVVTVKKYVAPCGSCYNWHFRRTCHLCRSGYNLQARHNVSSN
jgi:hypothetical protein